MTTKAGLTAGTPSSGTHLPKKPQGKEYGLKSSHDPWQVAEAILGISRRVLLRGKPGTGKTYAASKLGLRKDQKVYQITMTPETPMAEIRGHFIQVGGEFVWHDGPAIAAWREGARLVINEIDRASEDVHSLLFVIMDDPEFAELTLPSGETVRPNEGFGLVATMNGVPDDLPDALQDRLPVDIQITDLAQGAVDRLPEDLREACRNTALAKSDERNISIRMWMEFASLREHFKDEEGGVKTAAYAVFGDKADAALTALTIGNTASVAIDAYGNPVNEAGMMKTEKAFTFIKNYIEAVGLPYGELGDINVKSISEELRNAGMLFAENDSTIEVSWSNPDSIRNGTIYVTVNGLRITPEYFKQPV